MSRQDIRVERQPLTWLHPNPRNARKHPMASIQAIQRSIERFGFLNPIIAKPVALIERCLQNSTQKGDIVYEPFAGSGSTICACEHLDRKCRAIELSPGYVAVCIERWVMQTSGTPKRLE